MGKLRNHLKLQLIQMLVYQGKEFILVKDDKIYWEL